MARLSNPILFSKVVGIDSSELDQAGLLDPILNCDTKLFIDPLLLENSSNSTISGVGLAALQENFRNILSLLHASRSVNDVAWRSAAKILDLSERPETCLGYGGTDIGGSSRPDAIRQQILGTAKEILNLGENNPQIISLMGLFEEGVGPDTISDLTTKFIMSALAEITETFCLTHGIQTRIFPLYQNRRLPENPHRTNTPILLVPKDIIRHLPFANDLGEVSAVVLEIAAIRDSVNRMIGVLAQATATELKHAVRSAALESVENIRNILNAVLNQSRPYDENSDKEGYYALRGVLQGNLNLGGSVAPQQLKNADELKRIVSEIIDTFKSYVENNNLWELMWNGDKPQKERVSQLLFFGIADQICKVNNIDISPETNSGGGAVDFKFSTGYQNRVLVEIKKSKGAVYHGYAKQLDVYRSAAKTDAAFFLIINIGGLDTQLERIIKLKNERVAKGERVSEIRIVDAQRRVSASKPERGE